MGGGLVGDFGNTKGSRLDNLNDILAIASMIPGVDTFADLAAIPVDLARGDYISAGPDALGAFPLVGEIADTAKNPLCSLPYPFFSRVKFLDTFFI